MTNSTWQGQPVFLRRGGIILAAFCMALNVSADDLYVWTNSPYAGSPYNAWSNAAHTIQEAVDEADVGDTVWVTNGVYDTGARVAPGFLPMIALSNRVVITNAILVQSVNGAPHTFIVGAPDPVTTHGDAAVRCVHMSAGVLSGFTLTNGHTRTEFPPIDGEGGGARLEGEAELRDCVIVGNAAITSGGGVAGGTLESCIVRGNHSDGGSGGGGACQSALVNCLVTDNESIAEGGGLSQCAASNCTVVGNSTMSFGGGGTAYGTLVNCIVYHNSSEGFPGGENHMLDSFSYCCTTPDPGGAPDDHNIFDEPLFADKDAGDYHLQTNSPCIDSGTNLSPTITHDLEGTFRPSDGTGDGTNAFDMGCYEYALVVVTADLALEKRVNSATSEVTGVVEFSLAVTNHGPDDATGVEVTDLLPAGVTYQTDSGGGTYSSGSGVWAIGSVLNGSSTSLTITAMVDINAGGQAITNIATITALDQTDPESTNDSAWCVVTAAEVCYVAITNPTPSEPYTSWSTAATNIQDAIDQAALLGIGRVHVASGVYDSGTRQTPGDTHLNRVVLTNDITVVAVNGPTNTAIVGEGPVGSNAVRCVYMTTGTLSGFTITNGHSLGWGGGVWAGDGRVSHCLVVGNEADSLGGGVCSGVVVNCEIRDNTADYGGGAYGSSLTNCAVSGNSAHDGGGVHSGTLTACEVVGNTAEDEGGGAYRSLISNSKIRGNWARESGGGAYDSTIHNSVIARNSTETGGGGVAGGSLVNCTVVYNTSGMWGGGAWGGHLKNCIVYHNDADSSPNWSGGLYLSSCTTPDPHPREAAYANITNAPLLLSASHIATNSPCVGAGDWTYSSGVDIDGDAWSGDPAMGCDEPTLPHSGGLTVSIAADGRNVAMGYQLEMGADIDGALSANRWDFDDGTIVSNCVAVTHAWVSPGAYDVVLTAYNADHPGGVSDTLTVQVVAQPVYFVSKNGSATEPYTSWGTAASNIQDAVDQAVGTLGAKVRVDDGVYAGGGMMTPGAQHWSSNRVVITADTIVESENGPAVTQIVGLDASWPVRCVYMQGGVLSGFTLTNGHAARTFGDEYHDKNGGGVWAHGGIITNCVIVGCSANGEENDYETARGGGVFGGRIVDCEIRDNTAEYGGGVAMAVIEDCAIVSNTANSGAGVYFGEGHDCTIVGNVASSSGGGAHYSTLRNCRFYENSAREGGGVSEGTTIGSAISRNTAVTGGGAGQDSVVENCTIVGNSATIGGGIYHADAKNCIIYYNRAPTGPNWEASTYDIDYSCTTPAPDAGNNVTSDPMLVSEWRISPDSPCVGAGHNWYMSGVDIDGESWTTPNPSMGCDEPMAPYAGGLSVSLHARGTTVTVGYPLPMSARIDGVPLSNQWDLNDGTVVSNRTALDYAWGQTGTYEVVATAFNSDYPAGVSDTLTVHVVAQPVYHVLPSGTGEKPYATWDTAATTIQDAVDEAGALPGARVLVGDGAYGTGCRPAPGYYMSNRVVITENIIVESLNGPAKTSIVGAGPSGRGAIRGVYISDGVLDGFTITNGHTHTAEISGTPSLEGGGAIAAGGTLQNCIIQGNTAYRVGGVSGGSLVNCLVIDNTGTHGAGGVSGADLLHCTVSANTGSYGGGVYYCSLTNSIVYYNTAVSTSNHNNSTFVNSATTPAPSGTNNITALPMFADWEAGDFHLQEGSPCIDSGLANGVTNDIDGVLRPLDGDNDGTNDFDMGAYEYVTVITNIDLSITKTVDDPTPTERHAVAYILVVTNSGPALASGVVVTDLLPGGVTYASDSGGGSYASGSGLWTVGVLPEGGVTSLVIEATVDPGAAGLTITNTATIGVQPADLNPGNNSAAATVDVMSPMAVVSHSPSANTVGVSRTSGIMVVFDAELDNAALNANSFNVDGSLSGMVTGTCSVVSNHVTFSAGAAFAHGEQVAVTLTSAIESDDGRHLALPYSWSFTTEANAGPASFMDSGQALGNEESQGVALGDVDGDGDLDALVGSDGSGNKTIWLNNGGEFSPSTHHPTLVPDAGPLALGDLDGDGDVDAFVISQGYHYRGVAINDGTGVFTCHTYNGSAVGGMDVALGDFDGDGDLDAFVANIYSSSRGNRVWLNDGSGNFADSGQVLGDSSSYGVSVGDVDGDGDLDAFVANNAGQANRVWLNDGMGVFVDSGQALGDSDSFGVCLADVDGDGDLDAFVANSLNEPDKVWLNNGNGIFYSGQSLGNSWSLRVAMGDLDGDGDLDAFVTSGAGEPNTYWLNTGTGVFVEQLPRLPESAASMDVALGDLDGDGDLDAFVANKSTGGSPDKVWMNQLPPNPTLTVASPHGGSVPDIGVHEIDEGTSVDCLVTNSPLADGVGTQYVCVGWTGLGSVPETGYGTNVTVIITNDSSISWQWQTQYWYSVDADDGGTVAAGSNSVGNVWLDAGSTVFSTATHSNGYHFVGWTGTVVSTDNPLVVTMHQAHAVTAVFEINEYPLTAQRVGMGDISPTNPVATHGDSVVFTATPQGDEFGVAQWVVDSSVAQVGGLIFTLENITGVQTVVVYFAVATVPHAPSDLAATLLSDGVQLDWHDNSLVESAYAIDRRVQGGGVWNTIKQFGPNRTTCHDRDVAAGTSYEYQVRARNAIGSSDPSGTVSATLPGAPAAPSDLQAVADGTTVTLEWTDKATDEDGFILGRRLNTDVAWCSVVLSANSTMYSDPGLAAGVSYTYRLRAFNAAGRSAEVFASVATPVEEGEWGYSLSISNVALAFNGSPDTAEGVPRGALVSGSFAAQQSNPAGDGSLHRVALGFRGTNGVAVGSCVEVPDLFEIPGAPGVVHPDVVVPSGLRLPAESGTHTLWAEAVLGGADPCEAFLAVVRSSTNDLTVPVTPITVIAPPAAVVRVISPDGMAGRIVQVPILLLSYGNEHDVSLTVSVDPDELTLVDAHVGQDSPGIWMSSARNSAEGWFGLKASLPVGQVFSPGTHEIMTVDVLVAPDAGTNMPVAVALTAGIYPLRCRDVSGYNLPAEWQSGGIRVTGGQKEGDVAPRPNGDGKVNASDWSQMGRFVAGLDTPETNEFARADCAAKATLGDATIDVADWVQVNRYATGLDPLVPVGGPAAPAVAAIASRYAPGSFRVDAAGARLGITDTSIARDATGELAVWLDAIGSEQAAAFSIAFDSAELTYLTAEPRNAATNAMFLPNTDEDGRVGFALQMPEGLTFSSGSNTILNLRFAAAPGSETVTADVSFADSPTARSVSDSAGGGVSIEWDDGAVTLVAPETAPTLTAPTGVIATAVSMDQINLAWVDIVGEEGYVILRQDGGIGAWQAVASLASNSEHYVDSGLSAGSRYGYRVAASNSAGTVYSATATGTTWVAIERWRAENFGTIQSVGDTADTADWDGDGEKNLMEYAVGRSPVVFDTNALYDVIIEQLVESNAFAVVRYRASTPPPDDVELAPEMTSTLLSNAWQQALVPVDRVTSNGVETIRFRAPEPTDTMKSGFFRLKAWR